MATPPLTPDAADDSDSIFSYRNRSSQFKRRRPLFWLTLALCAGIAADSYLAPGLPMLGGGALALVAAAGALLFLIRGERSGARMLLSGCAVALAAGMVLHALQSRVPPASDVSRRTPALPTFVWLRGTVSEAARPPRAGGAATWTLSVSALGADAAALKSASGCVQLKVDVENSVTAAQIAEGDTVELRARIEAPPEVTLPDAFDYGEYLENHGIRRTGVAAPASVQFISGPAWWRIDYQLRRASAPLAERIETLLPEAGSETGSSRAALLNALLFGRRERIDISDREAFAATGAAHLLAISGLQIQFLAWLLWRAAALCGLSRRKSAWLVLLVSCGYCALAGGDAPILRATVMIALYLGGVALWREPDPLSVLAASALAILLVSPGELFSAGFQLSFLAVLALVTLYPAFEEAGENWRSAGAFSAQRGRPSWSLSYREQFALGARRALLISLAAWLGTAPAVAWHMGRFATLGLGVNLLAVPLGSICMVLGALMLGGSAASLALAALLAFPAGLALFLLQWINAAAAAIPFAALDVPPPVLPVMFAYTGMLAWIWTARPAAVAPRRLAAIVPACLLLLCSGALFREAPPAPSVTVLDIPRGRAALVETPDRGAALIDAGGFGQGARIAETLRRRGVAKLALVVITADESDAIDGCLELLRRVPTARVILPRESGATTSRRELEKFLAARDVPYGPPREGDVLQGPGDVRWEFSDDNPPGVSVGTESMLAVRLQLPGKRVLFASARSSAAMQRYLAKSTADSLQADVLRLSTGASGKWPFEVTQLVRQSGCSVIIAGGSADPAESPGLDLSELANALNVRLLSPHEQGTLRVQADVGQSGQMLQAFRNGEWRAVE